MVKCTCGRQFKNMGKPARHILKHGESGFIHKPDTTHDQTEKEAKRYFKRGR